MSTPKAATKAEQTVPAPSAAKAPVPAPVAATPAVTAAAATTPVVQAPKATTTAAPPATPAVHPAAAATTPVVEALKEAPKATTTAAPLATPAVIPAASVPAPDATPAPAVKTEEAPKVVVAAVEAPKDVATPELVASTSGETPKVEETARELPTETEAPEQDLPEAAPVEPSIPEFAEESNLVSDLKTHEKKSLEEFKLRIEKAIKDGEFSAKKTVKAPKETDIPVVTIVESVNEVTETPATTEVSPATESAETSAAKEETKEAVPEKVEEKSKEVAAPVTPAVEEKATEKTKEVPAVVPAPTPVEAKVEAKPTIAEKAKGAAAHSIAAVTHLAEKVAEKAKNVTAPAVSAVTHAGEKVTEKAKEVASPTPAPAVPAASPVVGEKVEEKTQEAPVFTEKAANAPVAVPPVVEEKAKDVPATAEPVSETVTAEDPQAVNDSEVAAAPDEDISLWGVPLLYTKGDKRTDVILLKFLRARDFNVNQAFKQLKKTVNWRREFKTDNILEEEFGTDLDGVAYMHGRDKEGHPVCYNVFGQFQDKELYQKAFGDQSKISAFLRWRVQILEKGIGLLNFTPEGPSAMVQIVDMKNTGFFAKKDLKSAANQATDLLQDNYPELVVRKIFVNAPWYFSAVYSVVSPFLSQRTKSKFTVAPAGKTTEHLLKFIPAEHIPVYYGGLSRTNDPDFAVPSDAPVQELVWKAGEKQTLEIPLEAGATAVWELVVVGYEVNYEAEFVPSQEGAYAITVEKSKKLPASTDSPIRSTFKAPEAGKVVLTIDNSSTKKKIVLYRNIIKAEDATSSA